MRKRKLLCCVIFSVIWMIVSVVISSANEFELSASEEDIICRFITAACGEEAPLAAKLGVANIVLNRLADSTFPNTVTDVIFLGEFECVENGELEDAYLSPRSVSAEDALMMALSGRDPTNGALFFVEKSLGTEEIAISFEAGRLVFGK